MAVQIGAKPDSGFDDPIGMLKDCHRRIERFLDILFKVVRQAQGRTLNSEEQTAVEAALHYFNESGPRHNMDEEESLFPRLRERCAAVVLAEIQRLEAEHVEAGALHREAEQLYSKWIAEAALDTATTTRLLAITDQLEQIYREHIRIEEGVVFLFAANLLDRDAVSAMGSEFKLRRK
jgi:hemerythrin-like domain-containing protein